MELRPEQKQQIEDEERQRVAEEQYRAQVRARLRPETPPAASPTRPDDAPKGSGHGRAWVLLAILALVALYAIMRRGAPDLQASASHASSLAPSVRYVPATENIASGQVTVPARGYVQYRFEITPEMRNARVSGHFSASGGAGNDVAAVIATESEETNWINGHDASAFYSTHGRETNDSFDVRLAPGVYYFAISNKFSEVSAKYVFLQADLNYSRAETY